MDIYGSVNIEMRTPGIVFCLPKREAAWLLNQYPECMIYYNQLLMKECKKEWEVKRMLYLQDADERYRWFIKMYPGVIDWIDHKVIASFLNMSAVTLSRVINQ